MEVVRDIVEGMIQRERAEWSISLCLNIWIESFIRIQDQYWKEVRKWK